MDNFSVADMWYDTLARPGQMSKACLIFAEEGTVMTYAEVEAASNQIAHWAIKAGLKPRDNVAFFMENRPQYVVTWLGLCKAGVAIALINSNNRGKPLFHSIKIAEAKLILFGSELSDNINGVLDQIQSYPLVASSWPGGPDCPAFARNLQTELEVLPTDAPNQFRDVRRGIKPTDTFGYIYTSGTTGLPKACVMKHIKYATVGRAIPTAFELTEDDVLYTVLPLYHSAGGMLGVGAMMSKGLTLVIRRKFSATKFFEDCTTYKITATQYIGELCRYLINTPVGKFDRAHHVRVAFGNGLRREVWPVFQERFNIPQIGEFYGATEGNVSFMNFSKNGEGIGSVGT